LLKTNTRSELFPLTATPEDPTHPHLLHAAWTPKQGHALVIVFNYDIYYRPGPRGNAVYRVTEDAVPGVVSNGVPDWVYEGKLLTLCAFSIRPHHLLLIDCCFSPLIHSLLASSQLKLRLPLVECLQQLEQFSDAVISKALLLAFLSARS